MKNKFVAACILLVAISPQLSCAADPDITSFYLIRHAEKELEKGDDPQLTQAGRNRVSMWVDTFSQLALDAVYSTDTTRTRDTAKPIALDHDLRVQFYDPKVLDYEAFIAKHRGQSVLIVGHSNTSPAFANRLLGSNHYPSLDESNYGSLYIVDISGASRIGKLLQFNPAGQ
ncbi:MAG: histidine phosphatase family protein [Arenicella sp.]|nr:histidine phosphatase family protein [Arenicella sp.]